MKKQFLTLLTLPILLVSCGKQTEVSYQDFITKLKGYYFVDETAYCSGKFNWKIKGEKAKALFPSYDDYINISDSSTAQYVFDPSDVWDYVISSGVQPFGTLKPYRIIPETPLQLQKLVTNAAWDATYYNNPLRFTMVGAASVMSTDIQFFGQILDGTLVTYEKLDLTVNSMQWSSKVNIVIEYYFYPRANLEGRSYIRFETHSSYNYYN